MASQARGWLYFLGKRQQGIELETVDRDTLLEEWSSRWSRVLDAAG